MTTHRWLPRVPIPKWLVPRHWLVDYLVSQYFFFRVHGRFARLDPPATFSDHYFRIKLRELHDPLRVFVSDKELVKWYVKMKIGDAYNIPTIAILKTPEEVEAMAWPDRCVIKSTHGSGDVILKQSADDKVDTALIKSWLKKNFYDSSREVNYRHLQPKIIVEAFADFGTGEVPEDYKIFCFFGRPKIVQINIGRFADLTCAWYTTDWQKLPFTTCLPIGEDRPEPENLGELLRIAEVLSAPFRSIRVDLYTDGKSILVGELTNVHLSSYFFFLPEKRWDFQLRPLFEDPDFDIRSVL